MKERVKHRIGLLKADARHACFSIATGDVSCITRGDRIAFTIGFFAAMLIFATGLCFADGLIDTVGETATNIYGELGKNLLKVAGLAAGACIVWFLCCTNDEDARRPIKWFKRIVFGTIGFLILGAFFNFLDSKTDGMGFEDYYGN